MINSICEEWWHYKMQVWKLNLSRYCCLKKKPKQPTTKKKKTERNKCYSIYITATTYSRTIKMYYFLKVPLCLDVLKREIQLHLGHNWQASEFMPLKCLPQYWYIILLNLEVQQDSDPYLCYFNSFLKCFCSSQETAIKPHFNHVSFSFPEPMLILLPIRTQDCLKL